MNLSRACARGAAFTLLLGACTPAAPPSAPAPHASAAATLVAPPSASSTSAPAPSPALQLQTRDDHRPAATARLRLGHYSSADGLFGITLDRTPRNPRVRVDGSSEVRELGIKRKGDDAAALVSAKGDLVLFVDAFGGVTDITDPRKDRPLYRDGNADPLPEAKTPVVDTAFITGVDARVKQRCGSPIKVEVGGSAPEALRVAYHTIERAALALEDVCRDKAGQDAVRSKVRTVRITTGKSSRIALDGGVLSLDASLEDDSLGPFREDIRSFLEGKL